MPTKPYLLVVALPSYAGPRPILQPAKEGDAGADLYAAEDTVIAPGSRVLIPTGLYVAIPKGREGQVRPRSGASIKGLGVANAPGTVDEGYRGEIKVIAMNTNEGFTQTTFDKLLDVLEGTAQPAELAEVHSLEYSQNVIKVARGDRIAQIVFAKYERLEVVEVDVLPESTRGDGGFGSTGK